MIGICGKRWCDPGECKDSARFYGTTDAHMCGGEWSGHPGEHCRCSCGAESPKKAPGLTFAERLAALATDADGGE